MNSVYILFKGYMNSCHTSISFTTETEKSDKMSFLDIEITRENNVFTTNVYRKPTFSGVYTHFDSFVPLSFKFGMISTIIFRCFNLCSSFSLFHQELNKVKDIFRKNGYPISFIDNCIRTFLNKLHNPKKVVTTVEKKSLLIVLPYLGTISQQTKRSLYKVISKTLPCCKLNIVYKSSCRLSSFFRFKDRPSKDLISGVVYKFSCGSCNTSYIGQTKRHLKVRMSEHMGISHLTGKRSNRTTGHLTAVQEHTLSCDHFIDYDNFSVLAHAKNSFMLELKESLFIIRDNPVLNKTIRSTPLYLYN